METKEPVDIKSNDQFHNMMPALVHNSGLRPPIPYWGPHPPFFRPAFQHQGPPGWPPYPPQFGQFRFGPGFMGPPTAFSSPPPLVPACSSDSVSSGVVSIDSADNIWAQSWVQTRSLKREQEKPVSDKKVTISEAQQKLRKCVLELKQLGAKRDALLGNISSLSEKDWKKNWSEIEGAMTNVTCVLNSLSKPESLNALKANLSKRSKKRKRLKQQLAMHKIEAHKRQIDRQRLHQQADAWLADMQRSVERARRDESLKQEADIVLSEVTRRQSDGRRQIALLEALQKLRKARIEAVRAQGGTLSNDQQKQTEQSNTVIDRLLCLWSRQMDEYSKEEHGLRVMLEESAAKQGDTEVQNVRRIQNLWEACLFGAESSLESENPESLESLVAIRQAWDHYLVPDDVVLPMASTIPVGWVLPTTPNSSAWQKFLVQC